MEKNDLCFEIGTEELPPSQQFILSKQLADGIEKQCQDHSLSLDGVQTYSTPRRLAVVVSGLQCEQKAQEIERLGPMVASAFDKDNIPTMACLGFARSCGVQVDELKRQATDKGDRLVAQVKKPGVLTQELLPGMITKVIQQLNLVKPMRWQGSDKAFIRPVHWLLCRYGDAVVELDYFGLKSKGLTYGHRFHCQAPLELAQASDYHTVLYSKGYVVADVAARQAVLEKQLTSQVEPGHRVVMPEGLLDEVVGLVEWPIVLKGRFDPEFLDLPREVLITSMAVHQRYFAVEDQEGNLQPYFFMVSNIQSKEPEAVIKGNQRVLAARLRDAQFFYQQDQEIQLDKFSPLLTKVLYQKDCGTLADKVKRLTTLSGQIAKLMEVDAVDVKRAALLSKCDLMSKMVDEFPSLQGVMGYYYAIASGESEASAVAIKEHYWPRYSQDQLPQSPSGFILALADRLDGLVGIIGSGQMPTGDKDPFGCRRMALGVIRLLMEGGQSLDLKKCLQLSYKTYKDGLKESKVLDLCFDFMMQRLKYDYVDQGVGVEVFDAVLATNTTNLYDFNRRVLAVINFLELPESKALAEANKRVVNILKKNKDPMIKKIKEKYLELPEEIALDKAITEIKQESLDCYDQGDYEKSLKVLSQLKQPLDQFFDKVLVMDKDVHKRQNRLFLLEQIRVLFSRVADVSLLAYEA